MKTNKFRLLNIVFFTAILLSLTSCFPIFSPAIGDTDVEEYDDDDDDNKYDVYPVSPVIVNGDSFEVDDNVTYSKNIAATAVQQHSINPDGDVDWVKFNALSNNKYIIRLSDIKGFEPDVALYDIDGRTVIEMKNTGTHTDVYDWWGRDSQGNYLAEEKESIVFTAPAEGIYYVRVKDVYDAHKSGSYKITLTEVINLDDPVNLSAVAGSDDFQINVSWDKVSNAAGYRLYRTSVAQDLNNPDYTDFTLLQSINGNNTVNYSDTLIEPSVTYYYYVVAYSGASESDPSNVDDAVFDWSTFRSSRDIINASQGQIGKITITFKDKYSNANIVRYDVYRSPDINGSSYVKIGSFDQATALNTSFVENVDGVTTIADTYYYYCVKIIIKINNVETESDYSWFDSGMGK